MNELIGGILCSVVFIIKVFDVARGGLHREYTFSKLDVPNSISGTT